MLKGHVQRVQIADLDLSVVQPCRKALREDIVQRYMAVTEDSEDKWGFSSNVRICRIEGEGPYYVVDGQHRIEACRRIGRDFVIASVASAKDKDEVIREARSANAKHGENLTEEELNANIAAYLMAGGVKKKNTDIAALFGVSRKRIERIRERDKIPTKKEAVKAAVAAALADNPDAPVAEIARAAGVSRNTAKTERKEQTAPVSPAEAPQEAHEGAEGTIAPPVPPRPVKLPKRADANIPTDARGEQVPPEYWQKFGTINALVKDALSTVSALKKKIESLREVGAWHSKGDCDSTLNELDAVRAGIKSCKPDCLCACAGQGCKKCGGVGFLTKEQFDILVLPALEGEV